MPNNCTNFISLLLRVKIRNGSNYISGCKSLQNINTHVSTCKKVQITKKKTTTITIYICTVIVQVQMIFLFFFSVSPFVMLFSFVFFSQQNHKITHTPPSTTDLYLLPTTKSQNHPCSASTTDQGDTTQIQKKKPKIKISNNPS